VNAVKGAVFLRKTPFECLPSLYSNSENAIAFKDAVLQKESRFEYVLPVLSGYSQLGSDVGQASARESVPEGEVRRAFESDLDAIPTNTGNSRETAVRWNR
jgi:hypothetical protein